ncbi:MAG: EFR1 family ferrodoxin [Bacillota bacterium]
MGTRMLTLYFSGTGNSKYVAELFAAGMGGECHSIEEAPDFGGMIQTADAVAFVYPVYTSRIPRIMREFVAAHTADLQGKKLVILCTQMGFSGDGARCFLDLLPERSVRVLYAEHITMPNNINNLGVFPQTGEKRARRLAEGAKQIVGRVCADIKAGVVKKRGFNPFSRLLGLPQGLFLPLMERVSDNAVTIGEDCTGCGACVKRCPMNNLTIAHGKALAHGNCTECYRCINLCPQRAIGLYFKTKVKWQYQGIGEER